MSLTRIILCLLRDATASAKTPNTSLRLLDLRLDHVRRFLNGGDLLGTFLIERDFELLFERHHDFDGVERIRAQVDELGVRRDGVELRAELFGDDAANLVERVLALRARRTNQTPPQSVIARRITRPRSPRRARLASLSRVIRSVQTPRFAFASLARTAAAFTENFTAEHCTGRAANAFVGRARNCTCARARSRVRQSLASRVPTPIHRPFPRRARDRAPLVPRPRDLPHRAPARRERFFPIVRASAIARPRVRARETRPRVLEHPRGYPRASADRSRVASLARRVARTLAEALADMEVVKIADIFVGRACAWMCRARVRARAIRKARATGRVSVAGFSVAARRRWFAFERARTPCKDRAVV